jgi:outer membrane protein insertion porin family
VKGGRTVLAALVLALAASGSAHASTVRAVEVRGNRRIEAAAVKAVLRTKPGIALESGRLADDIRAVFRMGYFRDVRAFFDEGSGTLTFVVAEKTVLTKVRFEGNDGIDTEDLEKEVQTKAFAPYDANKVREDAERLRKLYDKKGYYLADIETRIEDAAPGEAVLRFEIRENRKVLIRRISFVGNRVFTDDELRKILPAKEKGILSFLTDSGAFQEETLQQSRAVLREYYGHHGYIRARIGPPRIQLAPDRRSLSLAVSIEEGERYDVGRVDLDGTFLKPKEELAKGLKLKADEVADTQRIQEDVIHLSSVYGDEGYAYANVIPRDTYDEAKKTVDIVYALEPGPKVRIERIEFKGNESTRDKVLRREMRLAEGDVFSTTKLRESKQNIDRLALYEEVKLSTARGSADDRMNILVEVKEKSTGTFSIGAGFNTLESFQVIGRIDKRNLFGYGTDISLDARVGSKTQAYNLQYRDEYFLDTRWGLTLNAFSINRIYSNFDLKSVGGTVGFDYPIYRKGMRRVRAGLTYGVADESLSDIEPTVSALFESGLTSSVTASLTYDTRNRVFEPSKGTYQRLSEQIAGGMFGGDNDFSKTEFDARWYFPAADDSTAFLVGGSVFSIHLGLGYITPLKDGQRVPLFERYYPGGILSLRGFPVRSLGPFQDVASSSDPTGLSAVDFRYGGNKQVVLNAEYVFPIIRAANIKGVVFFDMGNAFDNGESLFTLSGQRQSAGFGIRWFSPIGPLRFEWGFPLDKKKDESTIVFDFTIGSMF